jgi:hypothetical protein
MRQVRMLGLCLVAAFALAALAASSASALPEFGQCFVQPNHEGRYKNNVCTEKAKKNKVTGKFEGEFEWRKATEIEAAKKKFSGTGGEVTFFAQLKFCETFTVRKQNCNAGEEEGEHGGHVTCASEVNSGEISGKNKVANVSVTFKGCTFGFIEVPRPCSNTGTEGEIKLGALKGKLGFINKKSIPRQAGLSLESAKAKAKLATVNCGVEGAPWNVVLGEGNEAEGCAYPLTKCGSDGLISAITPVNTSASTFTQVFTANEETGEQIPSKFEGSSPIKELESYAFVAETPGTTKWSKIAESETNSVNVPEALEIKAN